MLGTQYQRCRWRRGSVRNRLEDESPEAVVKNAAYNIFRASYSLTSPVDDPHFLDPGNNIGITVRFNNEQLRVTATSYPRYPPHYELLVELPRDKDTSISG